MLENIDKVNLVSFGTSNHHVCVCLNQAGIYWVTLIDQFAASWVVLILVLLEIIGFCYIYGKYTACI